MSAFVQTDIDLTLQHVIDMYFKTVIKNAKVDFIRSDNRAKNHGITLVTLDQVDRQPVSNAPSPEETAACGYIKEHGMNIPITDPVLLDALNQLSAIQRSILISNIILGITLKAISSELHVSERMVKKHKHNALVRLQRMMKNDGEP